MGRPNRDTVSVTIRLNRSDVEHLKSLAWRLTVAQRSHFRHTDVLRLAAARGLADLEADVPPLPPGTPPRDPDVPETPPRAHEPR